MSYYPSSLLLKPSNFFSMTTIADLNDKWASYAGPGGWNGNIDFPLDFVLSDADA